MTTGPFSGRKNDFHYVFHISLISNGKELEQIKFRHLSKLKNLISNFVATSSHDPENFTFNFCLANCHLDLLSKGLHLAVPPKQADYPNFMTEFQLLYRSTLDLSMTSE